MLTRQYTGGPEYALDLLDSGSDMLHRLADRIVTLGPPALTASGDRLLYSTASDLDEIDLDTGAVRNLTTSFREGVFAQALLPPGNVISFTTYERPNTLYWMDIQRDTPRNVVTAPNLDSFAWGTDCL